MLKKIFKQIYKSDLKFEEYEEVNKGVFKVLKNRANITTPSQSEIAEAINKVLDARLIMKDQQKLIEKMLVKVRACKERKEHEIFMWKQEYKLRFEIDEVDYINEYKESIGKKTLTIEEKKILFRNRYSKEYNDNSELIITFDEYIETLENEKSDILDTKKLLSDYLDILKRVSY